MFSNTNSSSLLENAVNFEIIEERIDTDNDGLFYGGNYLGKDEEEVIALLDRDPGFLDQIEAAISLEDDSTVIIVNEMTDLGDETPSDVIIEEAELSDVIIEEEELSDVVIEEDDLSDVVIEEKELAPVATVAAPGNINQTAMATAMVAADVKKQSYPKANTPSNIPPKPKFNPIDGCTPLVQFLASNEGAVDRNKLKAEVMDISREAIQDARIQSGLGDAERDLRYAQKAKANVSIKSIKKGIENARQDLVQMDVDKRQLEGQLEEAETAQVGFLIEKFTHLLGELNSTITFAENQIKSDEKEIESTVHEAKEKIAQGIQKAELAVEQAQVRFKDSRGDISPQEEFYNTVLHAMNVERDYNLDKLERLIGKQSGRVLLERAEKMNLGKQRYNKLKTQVIDRNAWVSGWTDDARQFAKSLAGTKKAKGYSLFAGARNIQLRADRVYVLNSSGREIQSFAFSPDGAFYEVGLQKGRIRKLTGRDEWLVSN